MWGPSLRVVNVVLHTVSYARTCSSTPQRRQRGKQEAGAKPSRPNRALSGVPAPMASNRGSESWTRRLQSRPSAATRARRSHWSARRAALPPTSIYWHFADKDDLIAAVIERSFLRWMAALDLPGHDGSRARAMELGPQVAKAFLDEPDFLRLGLMLALERRPVEPRAREMFLQVRDNALRRFAEVVRDIAPELDEKVSVSHHLCLAGADGLFIAKEIGGTRWTWSSSSTCTPGWSSTRRSSCWSREARHDGSIAQLARQPLSSSMTPRVAVSPSRRLPNLPDMDVAGAYAVQRINLPAGSSRAAATGSQDRLDLRRHAGTPRGRRTRLRVHPREHGAARWCRLPVTEFCAPCRAGGGISDAGTSCGPGVTVAEVMAATEAVAPALEIVDSRIADWRITLADTIADNASSGAVVLGDWVPLHQVPPLPDTTATFSVNDTVVTRARGRRDGRSSRGRRVAGHGAGRRPTRPLWPASSSCGRTPRRCSSSRETGPRSTVCGLGSVTSFSTNADEEQHRERPNDISGRHHRFRQYRHRSDDQGPRALGALRWRAMVGIEPESDGLARARALGMPTRTGLDGSARMPHVDEVRHRFRRHAATRTATLICRRAASCVIDLTPAAIGPCRAGGQPRGAPRRAEPQHGHLRRAGHDPHRRRGQPGDEVHLWRDRRLHLVQVRRPRNARQYRRIHPTTSRAIESVGGAAKGKALIILNPAEPPMIMRDTVFTAFSSGDCDEGGHRRVHRTRWRTAGPQVCAGLSAEANRPVRKVRRQQSAAHPGDRCSSAPRKVYLDARGRGRRPLPARLCGQSGHHDGSGAADGGTDCRAVDEKHGGMYRSRYDGAATSRTSPSATACTPSAISSPDHVARSPARWTRRGRRHRGRARRRPQRLAFNYGFGAHTDLEWIEPRRRGAGMRG